jgi:nitrate/nitrite transporter NarK
MSNRYLVMFSLILAGEAIFSLPFHIARFFRATLLEVFAFTNANLGDVFAVYGVTAMIAYFPGGAIADRVSPRKLLAISLAGTALGGLYMASIPGFFGMACLFAYWGVTTILMFWAAMIRCTREWGGTDSQGKAFGILDGGRGLVAAGLASVAVVIFGHSIGEISHLSDAPNRQAALSNVIYFYTGVTLLAGAVAWILVPEAQISVDSTRTNSIANVREVLRKPVVWMQALIVVCAYCGYKGLDNYSLYAVEVMGMDDVAAAKFTATNAYLRPIAAVAAGILADRFTPSRSMTGLFMVLALSYGLLGLIGPGAQAASITTANILVSFAAVYGLRGVYFALLEETKIPKTMTGTAVGLISLIGFTPDIFFASIGGRLLDNSPGLVGHQHYFMFLCAIMVIGVIAATLLMGFSKAKPDTLNHAIS